MQERQGEMPFLPVTYMLTGFMLSQKMSDVSACEELSGICEKPLTTSVLNSISVKHFTNQRGDKREFKVL